MVTLAGPKEGSQIANSGWLQGAHNSTVTPNPLAANMCPRTIQCAGSILESPIYLGSKLSQGLCLPYMIACVVR